MALKLAVTTNLKGDIFELVLKNARYTIGRGQENDLWIQESYISWNHAELVRSDDGNYILSDLGSSNGTFLNGRRMEGGEVIKAGDSIKFGILKVEVQEDSGTGPKIVPLKDRPAFARKDDSHTGAIPATRTTLLQRSADAISAKGGT